MKTVWSFFKKETVLCIAAFCAVLSMLFVPPSAAYLEYLNLRILCLLFCLMALIAGFGKCGVFKLLAQSLLSRQKTLRGLSVVLVLLTFFCSMVITNDVALITFVPFTILVLSLCKKLSAAPWLITLQTIAANLGSMAMPFGNPQNLFLYANFGLSAEEFFGVMGPLTAVSLGLLLFCSLATKREPVSVSFTILDSLQFPYLCLMFTGLFVLSLLAVFDVVHYGILTVLVAGLLFVFSRDLLRQVDYWLLLTFICFFIFAGNIGKIPAVQGTLSAVMEKNALATTVLASQVISNVPAAVLLSGFSADWKSLLAGTNIGGLGTPIASLASLISLKLYMKSDGAQNKVFIGLFLTANFVGLGILTGIYLILF